jgi:hypothetical protein
LYALIDGYENKDSSEYLSGILVETFLEYYKEVPIEDALDDRSIRKVLINYSNIFIFLFRHLRVSW